MIRQTGVQWYLIPPCLTHGLIKYGSRVKWSNPGNRVAPSPTLRWSSDGKGSLHVIHDYGRRLSFYWRITVNMTPFVFWNLLLKLHACFLYQWVIDRFIEAGKKGNEWQFYDGQALNKVNILSGIGNKISLQFHFFFRKPIVMRAFTTQRAVSMTFLTNYCTGNFFFTWELECFYCMDGICNSG